MEFSVNHPILFVLSGILIFVVRVQSVYFLVKALRRARELGMEKTKLKKLILSAAAFTVAPAVAIVISVITLSKDLGVALPWLRLSVIGALHYETQVAEAAAEAAGLKVLHYLLLNCSVSSSTYLSAKSSAGPHTYLVVSTS